MAQLGWEKLTENIANKIRLQWLAANNGSVSGCKLMNCSDVFSYVRENEEDCSGYLFEE